MPAGRNIQARQFLSTVWNAAGGTDRQLPARIIQDNLIAFQCLAWKQALDAIPVRKASQTEVHIRLAATHVERHTAYKCGRHIYCPILLSFFGDTGTFRLQCNLGCQSLIEDDCPASGIENKSGCPHTAVRSSERERDNGRVALQGHWNRYALCAWLALRVRG